MTGGGTGGHLYPALAIIEALKERKKCDFLFIGTKNGIEAKVVPLKDCAPVASVAHDAADAPVPTITWLSMAFPVTTVVLIFPSSSKSVELVHSVEFCPPSSDEKILLVRGRKDPAVKVWTVYLIDVASGARYRFVLDQQLDDMQAVLRAPQRRRLPVVLTKPEIDSVFSNLRETNLLMAKTIYGCGLRLKECLKLRIKDIDFLSKGY